MIDLLPLGDRAFMARFPTEDEAARWALTVKSMRWPGVIDVVAAFRTVGIHADPDRVNLDDLADRLTELLPASVEKRPSKVVQIPVLYEGADLPEVARRLGLTERQVIDAHSGQDYQVFAIGFLPGFPYAGDLPSALSGLPRRAKPRTRVPAGSVAIVDQQTAIYPVESPGGWHLLGQTPLQIVDLASDHFPICVGDRLRFLPIIREEFEFWRGKRL